MIFIFFYVSLYLKNYFK